MIEDESKIDVPPDNGKAVCDMLRKHKQMWSGKLGKIKATELWMDLKPDNRPFKSPPHRDGPKTEKLKQSEINKQLKVGVIDRVISEWAALVLLAPRKKDVFASLLIT